METQAKIEIHSNGMSAVEKSMAKMSQEVQNLRSELKSGSSSQTKQPSAQVPIPLPLSSVLKESQLGNERTGEYQEVCSNQAAIMVLTAISCGFYQLLMQF